MQSEIAIQHSPYSQGFSLKKMSFPPRDADRSLLAQAHLRPTLYPEMVAQVLRLTGIDSRQYDLFSATNSDFVDYGPVVKFLNRELELSLDRAEVKVLSLLLTGLSRSHRFSGDVFITPFRGENSSIHSCHSALLLIEQLRSTGLLSQPYLSDPTLVAERRAMILGALLHDCGEILGEIHSLSNRVSQSHKTDLDKAALEREIFSCFLTLAVHNVELGQPKEFFKAVERARHTAGIITGKTVDYEAVQLAIADATAPLSPTGVRLRDRILHYYDLAEGHLPAPSLRQKFICNLIKNAEHVQGSRHMIRCCTKYRGFVPLRLYAPHTAPFTEQNPKMDRLSLPFALAPSARIQATAKFTERELGDLFCTARDEPQLLLAHAARRMTYQTMAELLHAGPPVINQAEQSLPTELIEAEKKALDYSAGVEERVSALRCLQTLQQATLRANIALLLSTPRGDVPVAHANFFKALYLHADYYRRIPKSGEVLLHNNIQNLPSELRPARSFYVKESDSLAIAHSELL